jgi:hypothetical protein
MQEKKDPSYTAVRKYASTTTVKNSIEASQKTKNRAAI